MAYNISEFPHTRTYQSDLGEIIKLYKDLIIEYESLINKYDDLIITNDDIEENIIVTTNSKIEEMLKNGEISLDLNYQENDKSIEFIFIGGI